MRDTGPACRLCRREGEKLFLKGEKCYTSKCTIVNKTTRPGMHGTKRPRASNYLGQLRAKQAMRTVYGRIGEAQFRKIYKEAERRKGATGDNLLQLLECRLDNVVYRCGFGVSRAESRQLVRHKAIKVNGKTVDIPSYEVKAGDEISVADKSTEQLRIKASVRFAEERQFPEWIDVNVSKLTAVYKQKPDIKELATTLQPHLVVELYSK
ncbi:MAG: 30S ribosomal protein S4 [Gammaproteobacteria bacterium]|nr:30S ribosomal protein S4 [Gammaproteobacteria bacterium]